MVYFSAPVSSGHMRSQHVEDVKRLPVQHGSQASKSPGQMVEQTNQTPASEVTMEGRRDEKPF